MPELDAAPPYEQIPAPRKPLPLWWIIGGGVLLLYSLGSCLKSGMDLNEAISVRNAETEEIARRFMAEGLPPAEDPLYARQAGVQQASLDSLNRFIGQFGAVSEFTPASCTIVSGAAADPAATSTFANCALLAKAELSPVTIAIRWVQEEGAWKIYDFQANFTDDTVLIGETGLPG